MKKTKMERKIYRYEFASGDSAELILGDKWRRILEAMDSMEQKSDNKENRKCLSLDPDLESGKWLVDLRSDPAEKVCMKETIEDMNDGLDHLVRTQREAVKVICLEEVNYAEFAASKGITPRAAYYRVRSARKKIEKNM